MKTRDPPAVEGLVLVLRDLVLLNPPPFVAEVARDPPFCTHSSGNRRHAVARVNVGHHSSLQFSVGPGHRPLALFQLKSRPNSELVQLDDHTEKRTSTCDREERARKAPSSSA